MIGHNLDRQEQIEVLDALGAIVERPERLESRIRAANSEKTLLLTRKELILLIQNAEDLVDLLGKLSSPVEFSKAVLAKARTALEIAERGTN
jgi:hypothetical protein